MTEFDKGVLLGLVIVPLITLIRTLMTIAFNAWNETSACTGDCNQGRNCTCMGKKDE
jgi:hypothetical protein